MSSTLELNLRQLEAARALAWKQTEAAQAGTMPDGVETSGALLTLEAAREWINEFGLVLFAPRAQQLPAPAPSLVEATLGVAKAAPTPEEREIARGLAARLASEGLALPLNLLGVAGETPDFIVSARVFSYVFTMRGDKAWKQPPSTSGAVKVSPLGLRIFEVLTERGAMTSAELAQESGREVTESAVVRALDELWSQLRVIPLSAQGSGTGRDGHTLWELTTRRFTKSIKAGANSGQPSALSALVSLYLTQVFAATEEEITTFLSPLTARSRVREVLHALVAARELETVVIEGRTLLHLPGGLPDVAMTPAPAPVEGEVGDAPAKAASHGKWQAKTGAERKPGAGSAGGVKSWGQRGSRGDKPRPAGDWQAKPPRRDGSRRDDRRPEGRSEISRRPFQKKPPVKRDGAGFRTEGGAEQRSFAKPWEEERRAKSARRGQSPTLGASGPRREPARPRGEGGAGGARPFAGRASGKRVFPGAEAAKKADFARGKRDGERSAFKPRRVEGSAPSRAPFEGEGSRRAKEKPGWGAGDRRPRRDESGGSGRRYDSRSGKPRGDRASEGVAGGAGPRPARTFTGKPGGTFGAKPGGTFGGKPAGRFAGKPGGKFTGKPGGKFGGKAGGTFGAKAGGKGKFSKFAKPAGSGAKTSRPPAAPGRKGPEAGD